MFKQLLDGWLGLDRLSRILMLSIFFIEATAFPIEFIQAFQILCISYFVYSIVDSFWKIPDDETEEVKGETK